MTNTKNRVSKTRDPVRTRVLETRFLVFVIPLCGQIFHMDQIQPHRNRVYKTQNLPTISYASLKFAHYTLSLSNTLSKFKHSHSNTQIMQTLSVSQTLSLKHRNHSPLTLKCSPLSSQLASNNPLTHTFKIPFVPTNGSSDFFQF